MAKLTNLIAESLRIVASVMTMESARRGRIWTGLNIILRVFLALAVKGLPRLARTL